jgi:hypothetical protein
MTRKTFKREDLKHIELSTETVDGKRFYRTPCGGLFPSVTTVLSAMKNKTYLNEWKRRIGEDEANTIMRKAAGRGTAMHYICEDYLNNKEDYIGGRMPIAVDLFRKIQPVLDDYVDVIYGNEIPLYSSELGTAGRTDMFCRFFGTNTIVDFKTATKDKKEDWIEDYFLQSTAYAMMLEEVYKNEKLIYIPQIAIIIALQEGETKYQMFVKKTSDYREKVKQVFNDYHKNTTKN